jgi:hypothetical protein
MKLRRFRREEESTLQFRLLPAPSSFLTEQMEKADHAQLPKELYVTSQTALRQFGNEEKRTRPTPGGVVLAWGANKAVVSRSFHRPWLVARIMKNRCLLALRGIAELRSWGALRFAGSRR